MYKEYENDASSGLTKEQILEKVKAYILKSYQEKTGRLEAKKQEARFKDALALANSYNRMLWDEKVGLYEGGQETGVGVSLVVHVDHQSINGFVSATSISPKTFNYLTLDGKARAY